MSCMRDGIVMAGLMAVLAGWCAVAGAGEIPASPELDVGPRKVSPVVDGELDEACWKSAKPLDDFYLYKGEGERRDVQTVKVVHDDAWLYIAYEIERPHSDVIESTVSDHDGNVSATDSIEIFLDPGTDGKLYFHYMLSVENVRAERSCHPLQEASRDMGWNVPWRSATKITKKGWQAEIAIPLAILAAEGPLDKLRINLCLNRIMVTVNYMNVPISARREISSWAPVNRGFHEPERFGLVKGLGNIKPKPPVMVAAQGLDTSEYRVDDEGNFFYTVSGMVRSFSDGKGTVSLVLEDQPAKGEGGTIEQKIEISGKGDIPFEVSMPVTELGGRMAELSLRDPKTGELLEALQLRDMADLSLMRTYPRLSYYTDEKSDEIVCEIGLPASEREKMKLVAKNASGKAVAEVKKIEQKTLLPVPSKKLKPGEHLITVELQRADGSVAVAQEVTLLKRKPNKGCEWKIDHANKVVLNNGKPYFPFGIMARAMDGKPENDEIIAKDLASMGFNTVVRWGHIKFSDPKQLQNLYKLGKKHGFYVVDRPHAWKYLKESEKPWAEMTEEERIAWSQGVWDDALGAIMNNPRLISYYLADEPGSSLEYAAAILRMYNYFNKTDGYHPSEVLYIPPVPDGDVYVSNCDIIGIDPYFTPGGGVGDGGSPNRIGKQTWLARRRADKDLKLNWVTPCAENWSGIRMRFIDGNEQRVQTYLALIHGASGLLYFVYPFQAQQTYDVFKDLGAEMKVLGPACAAGAVPQSIDYSPVGFDPLNNIFPDVQIGLKRNPKGGYILMAANVRIYPVDVRYTVSLLGKSGKVKVLFDKMKPLAVSDGSFSDSMERLSTRAYAIDGPAELDGEVAISVDVTAHRKKADPYYAKLAIPDRGLKIRKNILRNSSFENESIPGVPDYYTDIRTAKTGVGYRLGDTRGDVGWNLDKDNPYHGKNSLCVDESGRFFLIRMDPKVTTPTKFVFSAYVRGKGRLQFYGAGRDDRKNFDVSDEWKRISQVYTFNPNPAGEYGIIGFSYRPEGSIWIDAIQFEKGTEPTEYEPLEIE